MKYLLRITIAAATLAGVAHALPPSCGVRGGAPAPQSNGQISFGSYATRASCQAACNANPNCKCIVYAEFSTICSLHTKSCSDIRTTGTSLLYFDKFCPIAATKLKSRAITCDKADEVLSKMNAPALKAVASSFCSEFIRATVTSTITEKSYETSTSVVELVTPTATQTITNSQITTVTEVITTYSPDVVIEAITTTTATTFTRNYKRKRGVAIPNIFPYASEQLSSACSCIVTPPARVITQTEGDTETVFVTSTSVVGSGVTTTTTAATITDVDTITTTLPPQKTSTTYTATITVTMKVQQPPSCGLGRGGSPGLPSNTGQYSFGSYPTRGDCQKACDANPICKCIVYSDTSTICSLHTKYCSDIRTPGTALLYFDKFCPI